jgi:hypothetical protein
MLGSLGPATIRRSPDRRPDDQPALLLETSLQAAVRDKKVKDTAAFAGSEPLTRGPAVTIDRCRNQASLCTSGYVQPRLRTEYRRTGLATSARTGVSFSTAAGPHQHDLARLSAVPILPCRHYGTAV